MVTPQLGCLAASPTKREIKFLLSGHDINDEIIRAVLGLHLASLPEPRTFQVMDPSYCKEASMVNSDRGQNVQDLSRNPSLTNHNVSSRR